MELSPRRPSGRRSERETPWKLPFPSRREAECGFGEHGSSPNRFFVGPHQVPDILSGPLRLRVQSQKFRKGVGRQRGLARGDPSCARDSGLFSVSSFLCPLRRRGTHFWRTFLSLFGGLFVANPPPANPFSKPLTIAVEDAVENRGLYRIFVLRLF